MPMTLIKNSQINPNKFTQKKTKKILKQPLHNNLHNKLTLLKEATDKDHRLTNSLINNQFNLMDNLRNPILLNNQSIILLH